MFSDKLHTIEDDVRKLAIDAQSLAIRFRHLAGREYCSDMIRSGEFSDFSKWLNRVADQLEIAHRSGIRYAGAPQSKFDI